MGDPSLASHPRKGWARALIMVLMAPAFYLAATVLLVLAIAQLVLLAVNDAPNDRLRELGATLGRYLAQIANFVTFATEEAPFPFSDWPAS